MSPDEIAGTRSRDDIVTLPPAMAPVANYVSAVRTGNLVFVSGQGPIDTESGDKVVGEVGDAVSVEDAKLAARLAGLNAVAAPRDALGSLDRAERAAK